MANITPFSGSSRTLASVTNGGGSGGADILEAMKNIYADEEVMRDWARESGLGYENFMTVDDKFKVIPCVPKRTRSKIADLFLNDYKSGKLPSKGFMKIPQILTRVARTCASDVAGLIAVSLRDSAHPTEAVDGQRYIVPLTALPAVFAFAPTFDLPLDKIGNETRSFFIAAELIAVTGHKGSVAAINNFWSVEFSMKCGNYTRKKPGATFILPHDRLAALPEEVLRGFVRGCLDYSTHPAFMQATRALNGPDPEVGLSSESNKPQISDGEVSEIGKVPEGLTSLAGIHMGSTPATVSL